MASSFVTVSFEGNLQFLQLVVETVQLLYGVECFHTTKSRSDSYSHKLAASASTLQNDSCQDGCLDKNEASDEKANPENEDGQSSRRSSSSETNSKFKGEVVLFLQSKESQENIEKAESFLKLHLIPGEDYIRDLHQSVSQEELAMVHQCSRTIQSSSLALVNCAPHKCEILYSGPKQNVHLAQTEVNKMILEKVSVQSNDHIECDGGDGDMSTTQRIPLDHTNPWSYTQISSTATHFGPDSFDNDAGSLLGMGENLQEDHRAFETIENELIVHESNLLHHNYFEREEFERDGSPVSSFSSSSYSDNEEPAVEENVLVDPLYNQRVEDALRLGFPEEHVKLALTKLGPNCAKNDLLLELMKIKSEQQQQQQESTEISVESGLGSVPGTSLEQDFVFGQSLYSSPVYSQEVDQGRTSNEHVDLASDFQSAVTLRNTPVDLNDSSNLRHIIIDGSNVAMSHGKNVFSCRGIKIVVDWFRQRGHKEITAFVPQWRKETSRPDAPITDQEILTELEKEKIVVFTPARRVKGRRVVCYDDRYVLNLAVETDGIVVSNDVYRDLVTENEAFRKVVDTRLLMYSFAKDIFMPPEDPYGRSGPSLDNLLRKIPSEPTPRPQDCPYGKKCTYGNKCRFYHPERGFMPQKSISETLKEQAKLVLQERASKLSEMAPGDKGRRPKQKLTRTRSLVPDTGSALSAWSPTSVDLKKEKPKLVHSKSWVDQKSQKKSEYLDESRRKLEEAEQAEELQRASFQDSFFASQATSSVPVSSLRGRKKRSMAEEQALRTSPLPESELAMAAAEAGSNVPVTTSPVRTLIGKSPCASPSHLTVPKHDQPERYLSGHLLVAKHLSDENSDHPSSPSSTRTSSPVIMKPAERRGSQAREGVQQDDPHTRLQMMQAAQSDMPNLSILQKDFSISNTDSISQRKRFDSQELLVSSPQRYSSGDNLPNLSFFESVQKEGGSLTPSSNLDPVFRNKPGVEAYGASNLQFSGVADTSGKQFNTSGQYPSSHTSAVSKNTKSYPPGSSERMNPMFPRHSLPHETLQRSYSSTGNVPVFPEPTQPAVSPSTMEHSMLRSQYSVPLQHKQPLRRQSQPLQMSRQNSTSDPQLHQPQPQADFSDTRRMYYGHQNQGPFYPQHLPDQEEQARLQFQHQLQQQQQQHHQLQQKQQQYQQLPSWPESPLFSPDMSNPPPPPSPYLLPRGHSDNPPTYVAANIPPPHLPSPQFSNYGTMYQAPPTTMAGYQMYNSHPPLHSSQPTYPTAVNFPVKHDQVSATNLSHLSNTMYQQPPPSPMRTVPSEDDSILPEDRRYSIYYHMSSLFGEVAVRKVMNLNPTVLDLELLFRLIMKYKQENGI